MESFNHNITIRPLFQNKGWIYKGILKVLVKISLNPVPFLPSKQIIRLMN